MTQPLSFSLQLLCIPALSCAGVYPKYADCFDGSLRDSLNLMNSGCHGAGEASILLSALIDFVYRCADL